MRWYALNLQDPSSSEKTNDAISWKAAENFEKKFIFGVTPWRLYLFTWDRSYREYWFRILKMSYWYLYHYKIGLLLVKFESNAKRMLFLKISVAIMRQYQTAWRLRNSKMNEVIIHRFHPYGGEKCNYGHGGLNTRKFCILPEFI